jgi:hypothetical protein
MWPTATASFACIGAASTDGVLVHDNQWTEKEPPLRGIESSLSTTEPHLRLGKDSSQNPTKPDISQPLLRIFF